MRILLWLVASGFMAGASLADERPNILLIVADDLGYSDLGAYGGEIRTPHLDDLARGGLQLTGYRTSPTCGPTRAMLMTGVDHHRAGIGTNAASLRRLPELQGRPGYEGFLNDRVLTVATLLKDAGYRTYMTGKWDLGGAPGQLPTDRGFDRSFALPSAGASHFADATGTFRPVADAVYVEDGERVEQLPEEFYSSATYTDRLLEFIDEGRGDRPYFAYLAFTAPHWPLQVPDDWLDRYAGAYDDGWHAIRKRRYERQIEAGLLPAGTKLPPTNRAVADWASLSPAQRAVELRRMEIYAAMVELMDHHIGRLLEQTLDDDERESIVIFLSDNGSEGNDIGAILDNAWWIPSTFDNRLENLGRVGSYLWLGVGWGHATSSPFRLYKSYVAAGGIRAPAIFYSSAGRFGSGRKSGLVTVRDITPTILDLAGTTHPGNRYRGRDIIPPSGVSAVEFLAGRTDDLHGDRPIGWELYGNRALFLGDRKALLLWPPEGDGRWQLFDIDADPSEAIDLSAAEPERLERMIGLWSQYAEENGVAVFERDLGYGRYPETQR
ncbi:MAG: arylsulfatase [Woeseiaceae bacterium]|nr:arylsulfatase [Woeseiaceae bacterium]